MVVIDRVRDFPDAGTQFGLLLPANSEPRDRNNHRREDPDDHDDRDQLCDGEATLAEGSHSTLARPPTTAAKAGCPLPPVNVGGSNARMLSPGEPPRTRRAAISPPVRNFSGLPSLETMRMVPLLVSRFTTGGASGLNSRASPSRTSATCMDRGS